MSISGAPRLAKEPCRTGKRAGTGWCRSPGAATSAGPGPFAALAGGPDPAADTWGRADVDRLGQIHLDPPGDVPGLGVARWLDDSFPRIAADVFRTAVGAPVQLVEGRDVGNDGAYPISPHGDADFVETD